MLSQNSKLWIIGAFVFLAIIFGITSLILVETKSSPVYKETLVTNNNSLMTLKSGSSILLYTYPLENTPASDSSKFSGYFTVTIDAAGNVPSVSFNVQDDTGADITDQGNIVQQVSKINFTGVKKTNNVMLYITVNAGNQNLQNIHVHINR